MVILLFGYEPFLEFSENPSMIIAQRLNGQKIKNHSIVSKILPVDYSKVEKEITESIKLFHPDLVVGLGVAPGRSKITPEKIAINYKYSEAADNSGSKPNGELIDQTQSNGIFSTLPVETIVNTLSDSGIPSSLSLSAGGYLCNYAMFIIVRESLKSGVRGGFIHMPLHDNFVAKHPDMNYPSMDIKMIQDAIELSIKTSLPA